MYIMRVAQCLAQYNHEIISIVATVLNPVLGALNTKINDTILLGSETFFLTHQICSTPKSSYVPFLVN